MEELVERIAVLETKQTAQEESNKRQESHNLKIEKKVDAIYEVIMTFRGAKYLGWFLAAAIGYVVHTILPFLGYKQ